MTFSEIIKGIVGLIIIGAITSYFFQDMILISS